MRRTYKGVVKNGVIVLEGDGHLPDGTEVTVIVEEKSAATKRKPTIVAGALNHQIRRDSRDVPQGFQRHSVLFRPCR
jgi:hypothetical protein